jgi:hypothetical protein
MRIGDEIRQDRKAHAYHEAGHAIVNACIELPFKSVGLSGVDFDQVDDEKCSAEEFIKLAKGTTAGLLATSRYDRLHPDAPLVHTDQEGKDDQQMLQEIAERLKFGEPDVTIEAWKGEVAALLEIPYVWAAVEELARQLEEAQGRSRIPAKQAHEILRDFKQHPGL